jgi:hypothetical protein
MSRRINIVPTTGSPNTYTQYTSFNLAPRLSWMGRIRKAIAVLRGEP